MQGLEDRVQKKQKTISFKHNFSLSPENENSEDDDEVENGRKITLDRHQSVAITLNQQLMDHISLQVITGYLNALEQTGLKNEQLTMMLKELKKTQEKKLFSMMVLGYCFEDIHEYFNQALKTLSKEIGLN